MDAEKASLEKTTCTDHVEQMEEGQQEHQPHVSLNNADSAEDLRARPPSILMPVDHGKRKVSPSLPSGPCAPNKRSSDSRKSTVPSYSRKIQLQFNDGHQLDDGYRWMKHGHKEILGAKYPRNYYWCLNRYSQGCQALKQTQQNSDNPSVYDVFYKGSHTCGSNSPVKQKSPVFPGLVGKSQTYSLDDHNDVISTISQSEGSNVSSITALKESDMLDPYVPFFKGNFNLNAPIFMDVDYENPSVSETVDKSKTLGTQHMLTSTCSDVNNYPLGSERHDNTGANGLWAQHRLFEVLENVGANKIGIYGSGGVGKTTVMKRVFCSCEQNVKFGLVLWANVSKYTSTRNIQNTLVDQLGLEVPNIKSDDEVAMILFQSLRAKTFVLFLDDVCEIMDLRKIGIPIASQEHGCKIIISARSISICHANQVDTLIEAKALSEAEALKLFCDRVGFAFNNQEELYARAIVGECSGLPLIIKVVGDVLNSKDDILTWKQVLKQVLLSNKMELLKLGFDKLQTLDKKSLFLLSVLLTKGKTITKTCLVDCIIEDGLLAGRKSHVRRIGHDIIMDLVNASLLECSDDGLRVEVHDMISDLALMILLSNKDALQLLLRPHFRQICSPTFKLPENFEEATSDCHNSILAASEGLSEPPPSEKEWEESRITYLADNKLSSLPNSPSCSNLVTLFLQRNSNLRTIPQSFFDHMSALQILNLSKTRIKSLPKSLSKLGSLEVLVMRNCERLFYLPSVIGTLQQLLVLDVHGTELCQLPTEISELRSLTHLYMSFYKTVDEVEYAMLPSQLISNEIISNLNELVELSITVHPGDQRWTNSVSDVTMELSRLKLHTLTFHFPETQHLEYFMNKSLAWTQGTLSRFNFIVGPDVERVVSRVTNEIEQEYNEHDRCLKFVNSEDVPEAVGKLLSEATAFYLDHHTTAHSLAQFGHNSFNMLKMCIVTDCPKLKEVIDGTNLRGIIFPVMEHLSIHYSWDLIRIFVGPLDTGSFSMLRQLTVSSCPRLEYILSYAMLTTLSNLEQLVIEDCESLKYVVNQEQYFVDNFMMPPSCAELKIKVLKLHYLPKLRELCNAGSCSFLWYLNVYNCPNMRNLNLKPSIDNALKEIKVEAAWWDGLKWDDPALPKRLGDRVHEITADDIWDNKQINI